MNQLIYFNENNEEIVFKDTITDIEVNEFLNTEKNLKRVMNSIDYYNIVRENIVELMKAIIDYKLKEQKGFATINRHLFNMLSSFYSYVKFYERHYHNEYKDIFSEQFDKYDTYKIVSELRKYTTHCYLAITKVKLNILTENISIQIVPEDLLQNDGGSLRKDVRDILLRMIERGEAIDLRLLTNDFLNIFTELQMKIMNRMKNKIFEDLKILDKFIYGKNMNKRESYIVRDNGRNINTFNIFYTFFKKFQTEYSPTDELLEILKKMNKLS